MVHACVDRVWTPHLLGLDLVASVLRAREVVAPACLRIALQVHVCLQFGVLVLEYNLGALTSGESRPQAREAIV
jgi:hypothetical protein